MKDIILPVTCKQIYIGLMILPLLLFISGLFALNMILVVVGSIGLMVDAVILLVLLINAWVDNKLPRFPIRCKCE